MPIQSEDIKLLKSAVMADVPEGGGAPTATAIVDGASNAIFPDISELDRAGGRINLRVSPEVSEVSREGIGITATGLVGGAVLMLMNDREKDLERLQAEDESP